ncbi:MAG: UMP kinase, partial [Opitutus sp.]|nr:UMP kinase [Opitutus sp.]
MGAKSSGHPALKFKRIVLKLSGEVLRGRGTEPIDDPTLEKMCQQVKE